MQLVLDNLTCERGGRTVFSGVSARIGDGEGLRVTGPNGAGKTSLLRLIAGLLSPAEGRVWLEGAPDDEPAGTHCHFLGHADGIKRVLTVAENAHFWAGYLGGGGEDAQRQALETFGLAGLADIPAGMLSAGQARRLALARLALAPRPVWLLDEPDASLDAGARELLRGAMRRHLDGGGLLVAASHTGLGVTFAGEIELGGGAP